MTVRANIAVLGSFRFPPEAIDAVARWENEGGSPRARPGGGRPG